MNFGIVRVRFYLTHLIQLPILGCALQFVSRSHGQEFQFQSVGARIGFPAENTSQHFRQAEAFLNYNLWGWNLSTNWHMQSRIDLSTGWLGQHGDNAFIGTLGPSLELSRARFPVSIEAGF